MEEPEKKYYALHAVIFKKPCDIEKVKEEVKNYIGDKKKQFYRETKASYRFRNIVKSKFIKKSFKTKNLKNGISLIMGELKPENQHLEGGGIFDLFKKPIQKVKEFFSPRTTYNNTTTKNLKEYGSLIIKSLTIARTPILDILDKVVNLISFGKWSTLKKEYGFDKLFHLQLIANLGSKNLVIEKNEVINVNTSYKMGKDTETMDVPLNGKQLTVSKLLDDTRQRIGEKQFLGYNAFDNNCQAFIRDILTTAGLYNEKEKNFLFQDVSELAKKMPSLSKKIMGLTTKTGAIVNKLTGQGSFATTLYYRGETEKDPIYEAYSGINELRKYVKENALPHKENIPVEIVFKSVGKRARMHYGTSEKWYITPENELKIDEGGGKRSTKNDEFYKIKIADPTTSAKDKKYYKKLLDDNIVLKFGKEKLKFKEKEVEKKNETIQLLNKSNRKVLLEAETIKELKQFIKENVKNPIRNKKVIIKYGDKEIDSIITPELNLEVEQNIKEIKEIKELTLNQLKKIAEIFNEHMHIIIGSKKKDELVQELEKHLKVINGQLTLKPHIFELNIVKRNVLPNLNKLIGLGKMSLEDEFKMDEKDHEKKLSKFEKSKPDDEIIKETLEGLKSITHNGLKHIETLENMLKKEGGSAKSAGFIRAIMAKKNENEPNQFKKYNEEGFNELKITKNPLNNSSSYLVKRKYNDAIFKEFTLFFSYPSSGNDLYNNKKMRELYLKDKDKAKKAVESVQEIIYNEETFMQGLKKQVPDYDKLSSEEKVIIDAKYSKAIMSTVLSKFYDGMKPIQNKMTEQLYKQIKESYIKRREKKMSKKEQETNNKELDSIIERAKKGEEVELPIPTKNKKDENKVKEKMEKQIKEDKLEKKEEKTEKKVIKKPKFDYTKPSAEQEEINKALEERAKKQKEKPLTRQEIDSQLKKKLSEMKDILVKGKKKKGKDEDLNLDDLLKEYGVSLDNLDF